MNRTVDTARTALLEAFANLTLSRRHQEIDVGLIARSAGVARSTFYYHFRSRDDLLLENLKPLISALARLPWCSGPTTEVEQWLCHIWENRALGRRLFDGPAGRKISDALALALEAVRTSTHPAPAPFLADQIAGSMMSLMRAWVMGRASAAPADLARILWSRAQALAQAGSAALPPAGQPR